MRFVHILGTINAHILFGILYIVGIGAYALVWRTGNFFKRPIPVAWQEEEAKGSTLEDVSRQF